MKRLILLAATALIAPAALAGRSDPAPVTMIQIYGTAGQNFTDVFVSARPSTGAGLGQCVISSSCNNKTGFVLQRSHPLFREIYAAVLSSRHAGTPLGLMGDNVCTANGTEVLVEAWFPG